MLEDFKHHIAKDLPFLLDSKILVTVSGGLDSMLLLLLCRQAGLTIRVAHCNFNLRGVESDGDQAFVESYCKLHNIPIYIKSFDTSAYAKIKKTSTQIAARELRYQWFKELSATEGLGYILTAHHLNDELETFLINLGRGTGVKGLTGIPEINGRVVRPLLPFSRKRIKEYALQEKLAWREDSSNATDNYVRNHLRHHAIPSMVAAQPATLQGLQTTQQHLRQTDKLLAIYTASLRKAYVTTQDGLQVINVQALKKHEEPQAVLYQLLQPYDFTAWSDVYELLDAQSGKQIFSETHRLVKDRDVLLLTENAVAQPTTYTWESGVSKIEGDFGTLRLETSDTFESTSRKEIVVDATKLTFPLTIRKWEEGDFFYPFGMRGKKKLSKYLKDEKVSLIAKEHVWLLCNGKDIVWVIDHRADDRFKVADDTQKMIKFTTI
ncbi:tRNA lysidine(34) synthetase TilS [Dokdonia sp. R86516]|uniref:tRNA lysidine(34) synthetase TilS n=1 Tax=Dokdonia sp. R86516 TaxID=3093856 RepID=UPI0037C7825D